MPNRLTSPPTRKPPVIATVSPWTKIPPVYSSTFPCFVLPMNENFSQRPAIKRTPRIELVYFEHWPNRRLVILRIKAPARLSLTQLPGATHQDGSERAILNESAGI